MDFEKEAAVWDEEPRRVKLANDVAAAIIREIKPTRDLDALDFGCGTGLVTLRLQPLVRSITGVDSSPGMLAVFRDKVQKQGLTNVHPQLVDLEQGGRVAGRFHLLVSSMTMHHVEDTAALLREWFELLLPGGRLAVADLDTEDGSFHSDHRGVYHCGFGRQRPAGAAGEDRLSPGSGYDCGHRDQGSRRGRHQGIQRVSAGRQEMKFLLFLLKVRLLRRDRLNSPIFNDIFLLYDWAANLNLVTLRQ